MKILFTDFDATLATDDKKISDKDYNALKKLAESGVKIVLCTGRMTSSSKKVAKLFPYFPAIATYNGGELLNEKGEIIESSLMAPSEAAAFARYGEENGLICHAYTDFVLTEYDNPHTKRYAEVIGSKYVALGKKVSEYILENNLKMPKIQLCVLNGEIGAYADYLEKKYAETNEFWRFGTSCLGIFCKGINKGYALKRLCAYYGINQSEAVAVGDGSNDTEMIKEAGIGVAVQNADESLKAAADLVTESPNGGAIAEIAEKIFKL
ncbi:MAG: HAD family phosphatase [Clostridia bacterium]|nr:HAD family phosphatase [Clostridia bacterium]